MKKGLAFIVGVLFAYACNQKPENSSPINRTYQKVVMSDTLQSMMKLFIKESGCNSKYNNIYIDKVREDYSIITLQANHNSDSRYGKALYFTELSGNVFFIYNGMEQYFVSDEKQIANMQIANNSCGVFWNIIDSAGTYKIIKNGGIPFFSLPDTTGKFLVPEITTE